MLRVLLISVAVVGRLVLGGDLVWPQGKGPAHLEREYDREPNPKKRVKLAVELLEGRLGQLRSAYETEATDPQTGAVEDYLAAVERLGRAVKQAANQGVSKSSELQLRRQVRELENLKMSVSALDRPALEKVQAQVAHLRQEILYSIMKPRERSAKK